MALCLFFCGLLLLAGGCGLTPRLSRFDTQPQRLVLDDVPFYPQQQYQCGPATVAMLLDWNGAEVDLPELTRQVYSPGLEGSLQPAMLAAIRRHGYLAYPISGLPALMQELAAGHPVIVLQNLGLSWVPRWHYAVVIGFDRGEDTMILHSGETAQLPMSATVFARTWARSDSWGLLVLRPGEFPATVNEQDYLVAVAGLEQAAKAVQAGQAYHAATRRWPENFIAWFGLGNSLYGQGDYPGALRALRQAAGLRPENGLVLNNLALALAANGEKHAALQTIDRTIRAGGPYLETYQQTRTEIVE